MSIFDLDIDNLDGTPGALSPVKGKAALFVNVASKCGLTPQYTALEALLEKLAPQGFSVVGFPCNQFGGQEPGTADEIAEFCSTNYNVTFPITEKIDVNGAQRHPVYQALTGTADDSGHDGDIRWNFEKFVIDRNGAVVARFAPPTAPDDPAVLAAIDRAIAG
jgi:glutathione peroxidase